MDSIAVGMWPLDAVVGALPSGPRLGPRVARLRGICGAAMTTPMGGPPRVASGTRAGVNCGHWQITEFGQERSLPS